MYRSTPYHGSLLRLAFLTSAVFALVSMGLSYLRAADARSSPPDSAVVLRR